MSRHVSQLDIFGMGEANPDTFRNTPGAGGGGELADGLRFYWDADSMADGNGITTDPSTWWTDGITGFRPIGGYDDGGPATKRDAAFNGLGGIRIREDDVGTPIHADFGAADGHLAPVMTLLLTVNMYGTDAKAIVNMGNTHYVVDRLASGAWTVRTWFEGTFTTPAEGDNLTPVVIAIRRSAPGDGNATTDLFENGSLVGSGVTGDGQGFVGNTFDVQFGADAFGEHPKYDIGDILFYDRLLTDDEVEGTSFYLMDKRGL